MDICRSNLHIEPLLQKTDDPANCLPREGVFVRHLNAVALATVLADPAAILLQVDVEWHQDWLIFEEVLAEVPVNAVAGQDEFRSLLVTWERVESMGASTLENHLGVFITFFV